MNPQHEPSTSNNSCLWLTPCWDEWHETGYSASDTDRKAAERPYLHWNLAVELLMPGASDIHRGTAIQKLWNATDSRVRMLHGEYHMAALKEVLGWPKKTDMLEVLNLLGLARPLILRQLKEIRNSVEHQDSRVPSNEDCLGYIDSVWYFLRSTDIFASRRILSFERSAASPASSSPARTHFIEFNFQESDWTPRIRGWFPSSAISTRPRQGALELVLDKPAKQSDADSVYLSGVIAKTSSGIAEVIRSYFLVELPENMRTSGDAL